MKKCVFCAEEIQDAAIKCKHCSSMLQASAESRAIDSSARRESTYSVPKLVSPGLLMPGEEILVEARPFFGEYFGATVLLGLISFAWPPLFFVTLVVGLVNYAQWKKAVYVLTTRRIFIVRGLIARQIKQCSLDKVQNSELKIYWYNTKLGDISFDTAGSPVKELTWKAVAEPQRLHAQVTAALH